MRTFILNEKWEICNSNLQIINNGSAHFILQKKTIKDEEQ